MKNFKSFLEEGVNDPAIFKAVFLAGGPGSGKSFIVGKTALSSLGFKVVNSDEVFENNMKKAGIEMNPENIFSIQGQEIRNKSKSITSKRQEMYITGRLGLVIDGTGKDYAKIMKQKENLESLGYETAMIFVNTDELTAVTRNNDRERSLETDTVKKMWSQVQNNLGKFQAAFSANLFIVDNSAGADYKKGVMRIYRKVMAWSKVKPKNSLSAKWINQQK
jgi:shikimate kinase